MSKLRATTDLTEFYRKCEKWPIEECIRNHEKTIAENLDPDTVYVAEHHLKFLKIVAEERGY
jgi:hypothetical protein